MKKINWFRISARMVTLLAIGLISLFASDAFNSAESLGTKIREFAIHMVPSLMLGLILVFAWKREIAGGIIFILLAILLSPFVFNMNEERTGSALIGLQVVLLICGPFALSGILFLMSGFKKEETEDMPDGKG